MNLRPVAIAVPLLATLLACSHGGEPGSATSGEAADTERNCIIDAPIAADGYTELHEADPNLVTRMRLGADGQLAPDPEKVVRPSSDQVSSAMHKISQTISRINREVPPEARRHEVWSGTHRGETPEPYCLFHAPGKAVYGTVVFFHGFNDRPLQQAKLASYLFHNGFNVYNVFLANHFFVPGTSYWPKTVYKPEVLAVLAQKFQDPANQAALAPVVPHLQAGTPSDADLAVIDGVLKPELSLATIQAAWSDPSSDAFASLYEVHTPSATETLPQAAAASDFMDYVREATARIGDLADMPGPVFLQGLSVGGALSIAAAEADGGRRVRAIVSHAPWLSPIAQSDRFQAMFAGPLDDKVTLVGGSYPMSWPNHNIPFSPASIAADLALGAWTGRPANVTTLAGIATAQVVTEDEDSADNTASGALQAALTQDPRVAPLHQRVTYPKALHVGHAMTDPENYPDGPADQRGYNALFRNLYQESFRFFTAGQISQDNLVSRSLDPSLPAPSCVTPDFPNRCANQ